MIIGIVNYYAVYEEKRKYTGCLKRVHNFTN